MIGDHWFCRQLYSIVVRIEKGEQKNQRNFENNFALAVKAIAIVG